MFYIRSIRRRPLLPNKDIYIDEKLLEARSYVERLIGKKELYTHEDAYKLLNSFSFTQEIDFEEIPEFLPSAMKAPESILEYSKGFIDDETENRIYALNYGTGFIIIIISGNESISKYYGDTINDFTLRIYYALEIMCKNFIN